MYKLAHRVILLFITLQVASASRWWRDDGYDGLDDSPEPFPTHPPSPAYDESLLHGYHPLNGTTGSGIYHLLVSRQASGCRRCPNPNPVCCNNGTFCCALGNACQLEAGWCCPTGSVACPGSPNVCVAAAQTCCASGVCEAGSTCCGRTCCPNSNICNDGGCLPPASNNSSSSSSSSTTSSSSVGEGPTVIPDPPSSSETSTSVVVDPPTTTPTTTPDPTTETPSVSIPDSTEVAPFDATASLDIPPSSFVDVPSDPVDVLPSTSVDPAPSDTFTTPLDSVPPAADDPPPTSSVVVETSTSSGVTLTVSHTVQPFVATANPTNTAGSVEEASDAVALVYPWDPRIEYLPDGAWTSTTSSSSVGSCHNGTKVATQAGASIKFKFEGKQISTLICNGSKGGDYSIQLDVQGSHATDLSGYKDPGTEGDQCVLSQPFNSGMITDGPHEITIIVKGSHAGSASGGAAVEFGGFIYRGPHAFGTTEDSKTNIPAIVGGTVGGVVGGILIIAIIVVVLVKRRRKRRNERMDDAPAVHTIPVVSSAGTPYSAVPTTEYHDPYANSGYGPGYYPNPTTSTSHATSPAPAWRQTDSGPFGQGSYAATAY